MELVSKTWKLLFMLVLSGSCAFLISQHKTKIFEHFPISKVRIYGADHVDHKLVQHTLSPLVSRGFFVVEMDQIKDHLLQLPWVEDVFVRRVWPDRVDIKILERNPIAEWGNTNSSLLSSSGVLFYPAVDTYPANLPRFIGPDGKQVLMLKYYMQMNRLLLPLHARITYFELTPHLSWKVILDNGVTLHIGYKDGLTRLKHFVKVYPKIVGEKAVDVDYIDLRYSNGVAVRWRAAV